jgi:hypothetical protein
MMNSTKLTVEGSASVVVWAETTAIFTTYIPAGEEQVPVLQAPAPIPLVAASSVNGGKVVAVSCAFTFHGTLMRLAPGNTDLFKAIVEW